ncbi:MAG: hypothetical protein HYU66_10620 [Armatimonadetes bacterium]|nr:hypothetical protein [Armatimonadota bacterium]
MITYHCPHCRDRLIVSDDRVGKSYVCGLCGKASLVPGGGTATLVPRPNQPPRLTAPASQGSVPRLSAALPLTGDTLDPGVRAQRLQHLFDIERNRPLVQAEWLEAAEHYRALGDTQAADQMEQRAQVAAVAAQASGGVPPQVVIYNQNTNHSSVPVTTPAATTDGWQYFLLGFVIPIAGVLFGVGQLCSADTGVRSRASYSFGGAVAGFVIGLIWVASIT